ncbi:hypothetical protein HDU92_008876 [Lobulomyces angularis]|nr:hypothetical protein HDU92_008876 [Lobulomyces angularis]
MSNSINSTPTLFSRRSSSFKLPQNFNNNFKKILSQQNIQTTSEKNLYSPSIILEENDQSDSRTTESTSAKSQRSQGKKSVSIKMSLNLLKPPTISVSANSNTKHRKSLSSRGASPRSRLESPLTPLTSSTNASFSARDNEYERLAVWNNLKRHVISQCKAHMTKSFKTLLASKEFDNFLKAGVEWYIKVNSLQKIKEQSTPVGIKDIPENVINLFQNSNVMLRQTATNYEDSQNSTEMPSIEAPNLEQAKLKVKQTKKDFGICYCFLLLISSRLIREPAKDRVYFENMYHFTKEIVSTVVEPAFAPQIKSELNRLFRSELFLNQNGELNFDPNSPELPKQIKNNFDPFLQEGKKFTKRKKIFISDVRMARSPLADIVLPPPQKFLFVQNRMTMSMI